MTTEKKNTKPDIDVNFETVKDKVVDYKDEINEFVKKNPWAAVAIAAGLGFIIGRLLNNRDRS